MEKNTGLLIAIAAGAYWLLSNKGSTPTFKDSQGNVINAIRVGQTMTFDVPGYNQVWLTEVKNGSITTFDGPFRVPMSPYLVSSSDVGHYNVAAYELTEIGGQGKLIGQTLFTIQ